MSRSTREGPSGDPAVTVIIPSRDCLAYLPEALLSVERQDMPNVEVIVIDDGSTDGTFDWLAARRREMPWLTILQSARQGPNAARNRGIIAARAPLVAFLDADDVWAPGKLAAQLAFHAAHPGIVFSFTDYLHVDPVGRSHGTCFEYWPTFRRQVRLNAGPRRTYRHLDRAVSQLFAENVVGTSTVVARRDALQNASGFDARLPSAADWDLWLRLAASGPVGFTDELCAVYQMRRQGAVSSNIRLRVACMRRIVAAHSPRIAMDPGGRAAIRLAWVQIMIEEAELARSEGRRREAAAIDLAALCRAPSLRLWRTLAGDLRRIILPSLVGAE